MFSVSTPWTFTQFLGIKIHTIERENYVENYAFMVYASTEQKKMNFKLKKYFNVNSFLLLHYVSSIIQALIWTECENKYVTTSGSFPSETRFRALQPSDPIHENVPVALFRRTARITSRTSWSEPKMIAPENINKHNITVTCTY